MGSVADILQHITTLAPLDKAAGWDPVGLQVGDPSDPAARIAVCHEVTDEVAEAVVAAGLDMLIAYHPLLFRPVRRLVAGTGPEGRAYRLIRAGVALAVVHTAFDVVPGGSADALADTLGCTDVAPFGPLWRDDTAKVVCFVPGDAVDSVRTAMVAAGAGVIGRYTACSFVSAGTGTFLPEAGAEPVAGLVGELNSEPEMRLEMAAPRSAVDGVVAAMVAAHPYEEPAYDVVTVTSNAGFVGRVGTVATTVDDLAVLVAERLGVIPAVAGSGPVSRVAVIPGSGGDFVSAASAIADVVVTGDVGHHTARAALDRGIAVIDPGHAATERPGVARLYAALSERVDGLVDLTHLTASPWETR